MGCTLDGKMLKKEPVTIQRNTDVYPPFGTDKSVPYANTGKYTIQRTAKFQFTCLSKKPITILFFCSE